MDQSIAPRRRRREGREDNRGENGQTFLASLSASSASIFSSRESMNLTPLTRKAFPFSFSHTGIICRSSVSSYHSLSVLILSHRKDEEREEQRRKRAGMERKEREDMRWRAEREMNQRTLGLSFATLFLAFSSLKSLPGSPLVPLPNNLPGSITEASNSLPSSITLKYLSNLPKTLLLPSTWASNLIRSLSCATRSSSETLGEICGG